jgi:nucleolysin TIA-1/TIAR
MSVTEEVQEPVVIDDVPKKEKQDTQEPKESIAETPSEEPEKKDSEDDDEPSQQDGKPLDDEADTPKVTPALASQGGREVSRKILYVGGLSYKVTEDKLTEAFGGDSVEKVNILPDKNSPGESFAFVEFKDEESAKETYDKFKAQEVEIEDKKAIINWAYQSQQAKSNPEAINIFVGDLSTEINDESLKAAFEHFESILQAHVMWDMQTGHSRGYGFVSFGDQKDAEMALETMNGKVIAGRAIRLNWAHKQQNGSKMNGNYNKFNQHHNGHRNNMNGHRHHHNYHHHNGNSYYQPPPQAMSGHNSPALGGQPLAMGGQGPLMTPQSYDIVLRKAPSWQTTVYLGNLAHFTTQQDLIQLLQNFGFIVDLKFYPDRGCAFVKYDSHERAALTIVQLNGFMINGRPLKLGWGREKNHGNNGGGYQNYGPVVYGQ